MPGLRKTYFCTDNKKSIVFEEYKGPILDHHANSREIKVPRFQDNNANYLDNLSDFVNSCISRVEDDEQSVAINVRLGTLYSDAKLKDSHYQPTHQSGSAAFNSEAGAKFEDNIESVEEYVLENGFESRSRNEKLKVNCKDRNLYAYEMNNLEPVVEDYCTRLGTFDIVHNRNEDYLEDVRVQITSFKPASSGSSLSPLVDKNEDGDIILVNPEKVKYVRKQESSLYSLKEEQNQLDGINIHFRIDKKTQLDHNQRILNRCMTTYFGAQIVLSGSKDSFMKGEEFNKKLSEVLYDYTEWLSKMCSELDIGCDYSVLYYLPGYEKGFTRAQDLHVTECLKAPKEFFKAMQTNDDLTVNFYSSYSHPKFNEAIKSLSSVND